MEIAPVILASGFSRRFGSDKIMHKVHGKPLIDYVIRALKEAGFEEIFAVVRKEQEELVNHARDALKFIENDNAIEGQSSAIKVAVSALRKESDAIMFLLGDQPLIRADTIIRLCRTHTSGEYGISSCQIDGRLSPPVIFSSYYFDELMRLSGDTGAKPVLIRHSDRIARVSFGDRYEAEDVDSPEMIHIIEEKLKGT
ncbi:MAG: nucleotidyltransferase family protein [Thermoplasmataceae archaeon]